MEAGWSQALGRQGTHSSNSPVQLLAPCRSEVFEVHLSWYPRQPWDTQRVNTLLCVFPWGSRVQSAVLSCPALSHSWGVLAWPIARGARTLPSDSKCYEERAWSLPKSSRQTETVGKPLGQVQVFILQQKKLRGQGLAQGHRVDLQARQAWIQALDSWLGVFPTISALKQFHLGGRDTRPFQNPV